MVLVNKNLIIKSNADITKASIRSDINKNDVEKQALVEPQEEIKQQIEAPHLLSISQFHSFFNQHQIILLQVVVSLYSFSSVFLEVVKKLFLKQNNLIVQFIKPDTDSQQSITLLELNVCAHLIYACSLVMLSLVLQTSCVL